jgi:hypothetical protein
VRFHCGVICQNSGPVSTNGRWTTSNVTSPMGEGESPSDVGDQAHHRINGGKTRLDIGKDSKDPETQSVND